MASIVLSSTSFGNNDLIPPEFKNQSICGEANRSPQFHWEVFDIPYDCIEYYNLYVEDTDVANFKHWSVKEIIKSQTEIIEDGPWLDPGTIVESTNYSSGDRFNGWNGPCVNSGVHLYRAWVEVKI